MIKTKFIQTIYNSEIVKIEEYTCSGTYVDKANQQVVEQALVDEMVSMPPSVEGKEEVDAVESSLVLVEKVLVACVQLQVVVDIKAAVVVVEEKRLVVLPKKKKN